ncbi:MAG: leucyl/phenylalanyl-tRNA--protein transferase [Pseudohongiellaceae bacterium]|jgi:leucyl/phenylalanyl-tRNA--protein transferase
MTFYALDERLLFPPPTEAEADGLLAVGGDLSPERLLLAYQNGIFPWPHEGLPLLWFSPDPRMILEPSSMRVSRSLRGRMRRGDFEVTLDRDFAEVMRACGSIRRAHEEGTWITPGMVAAYTELHERGFAHSVEVWHEGRLAGGLYGVSLGGVFFGESMFCRVSDASKVGLATLVQQLAAWDFAWIDCQMVTDHLASLGAVSWSREHFLKTLKVALKTPTRRGRWALEDLSPV